MSDYFWETDRIRLRGVEPEDWQVHFMWDRNSEMMRNVDQLRFPDTSERSKKWAREASEKGAIDDNCHMEIESLETGEVIGIVAGHHADPRNGVFQYAVAIRPEFQRQGYASEAVILVLRFYFDELRYQKCEAEVHGWNETSKQLQVKLGFTQEGQVRRAIYAWGTYHDRFLYGMTIEEFRERYD